MPLKYSLSPEVVQHQGPGSPWLRLQKPQVASQLEGWSPMELQGHQAPTMQALFLPSTVEPMQPCGLSRRTKVENEP